MADYEPLRRQGAANKKKIFIGVGIAVVALVAVGVVLTIFWNSGGKASKMLINPNITMNFTSEPITVNNFIEAFGADKVSFNVTMRLKRPIEETKARRSINCDDSKKTFETICENKSNFKECKKDELNKFLESYVANNFQDQLKTDENDDPFFSGVNSTQFQMEIFNIKEDHIDIKALVTISYKKTLQKADNETDAQNELMKLVKKIKVSFNKCSNILSGDVEFGLGKYEEFKKVERYIGEWELSSSEKFEEFLVAVGVGYFTRLMAVPAKPKTIITYDKNTEEWNFKTVVPLKTREVKFKLDQEFDDDLNNGQDLKAVTKLSGDKFVQTTKDLRGNTVVMQTRELLNNNEMMVTLYAGDVVAKRGYKRIQA